MGTCKFPMQMDHLFPVPENFRMPPTEAEVDRFLRDACWEFSAGEGYHFTTARIYSTTWEKTLGFRPRYHFEPPKA